MHGDRKGRPEVLNSRKRYIYEIVAMYKTIPATREVQCTVGVTDYNVAMNGIRDRCLPVSYNFVSRVLII